MTIPGYDAWKLSPPYSTDIGTEEGQTCNRVEEPDEDAPRGYLAKPCQGVMVLKLHAGFHPNDTWEAIECDTCGEEVE